MSFNTPLKAIPTTIYSKKVSFETERTPVITDPDTGETTGGEPIANQYTLMYKLNSEDDSQWHSYILSNQAEFVYVDALEPQTLYDSKWILTGEILENGTITTDESESDIYTFKTRHQERFQLRPAIPFPLTGPDFPFALQAELDELNNYINTQDDEIALERMEKEGVGKLGDPADREVELSISGGDSLYLSNGFFQSGSGLSSTDTGWYPGAKFWQITDESGYLSLNTADTILPTSVIGDFYGYMGAYIDEDGNNKYTVLWSTTYLNPRPQGRWLIGRVSITEVGLYDSVDLTIADWIPSLSYLLENGVGGGGGSSADSGGGAILQLNFANADPLSIDYDPEDEWVEIVENKTFEIGNDNAIASISLLSDIITTGTLRFVVDSESLISRKEFIFNDSSGQVYLNNISTGIHTLKVEIKNDTIETVTTTSFRLQVLEIGGAEGQGSAGPRSARELIYDPQNIDDPQETTYENNEAFKDYIKEYVDDKINNITSGQSLSLDYLIGNIARGYVGQGETNPSSLLRIDASYVIPEVYGQDGIILTVDGEEVYSPVNEGEGSLVYDDVEKVWVV